jgi:hypothetical protein
MEEIPHFGYLLSEVERGILDLHSGGVWKL